MNTPFKHNTLYKYIIISTLTLSCASFEHGWNYVVPAESSANPAQILERAGEIESEAISSADVKLLIKTFKEVEKADPANYYALWKIGNYNILMGAAYSDKKKDKKAYYREAVKYCEKAMVTNELFKSEVLQGKPICTACSRLTVHEIDAMGYWYTARFSGNPYPWNIYFQKNARSILASEDDPMH